MRVSRPSSPLPTTTTSNQTQPALDPSTTKPDAASAPAEKSADKSADKSDAKKEKPELFKLAVTTFLAATSAVTGAQPPSPDMARIISAPPASTLHLDRNAMASLGSGSPIGRAVEVALRTGVLEIPRGALPTAAPVGEASTTATSSTSTSTSTPVVQGVPTSAILSADKVWMITTTSMASSSPLSQAFLQDLPPLQQQLATELLARAAAGDEQIAWGLLNAFRESVRTDASATDRQTMIRTALTTSTPLSVVVDSGLVANATPRQLAVFDALSQLGDNQIYAFRLIDSVVATVIDPAFSSKSVAEQQAAFDTLFTTRAHYLGVAQPDLTKPDTHVVVDGGAVLTAAACSATPAREFRLSEPTAHPLGCSQTATFTTPAGPDTVEIVTPPTLHANHPSVAVTAASLARVDDGVRLLIGSVVLNPTENPDDAKWRTTPGFSSTHTSFMTARTADNAVHVYPSGLPSTGVVLERLLAGTFTHEAAHLLQPKVKADRQLQALWEAATSSTTDLRASAYAFSNDAEDFAESFTIYMTSKGSDAHELYRTLMPARFAAFEAIEAKLLAKPAAPAPATEASTPRT